jgi:nucleoid DNA-binding protein/cell division septation protein DedD
MENYILSLIKENNRVIIPNFGAFIVAKENGFSVLFNNFLSFNDGLLVDHIVEVESVNKEEAERKINDYVEQVKNSLDEKGQYIISGLGTFTKDATGILRFEQDTNLSSDSEPKAEMVAPVVGSDELLDIDSNTESDKVEEETQAEPYLTETSLNDFTPIAEVEEEPIQAETKYAADAEEKKEDPVVIAHKYLDEDNSKRNRSITIFLSAFILLPLIGFIIYFFFFKDNLPAETQKKIKTEIEKVEPTPIPVDDKAGTIEAGPAEPEKEEPVEQPKQVDKTDIVKPHQLIVGSFSTEANANKMVEKLKEKGFEHCFWFMHNNRYLVSLESFAKVYEAQARQEEILESDRMESWIITKRK